jgi:hypothetical protein
LTSNRPPHPGLHYDLTARLIPAAGKVRVAAMIDWPVAPADLTQLTLALHSSAMIETLEADQPISWTISGPSPVQFAPEAVQLAVKPRVGRWLPARPIRIGMRYSLAARPDSAGYTSAWQVNRISPEWTELGLYTPWFPLAADLRQFTYRVHVTSEDGAPCLGAGNVSLVDGAWRLESRQADRDCVLVSAPDLRWIKGTHASVVYATDGHRQLAQLALADCEWLLLDYAARFGPLADATALQLIIAPRPKGGGYARHGLVVVTPDGLSDRNRALRWLAHETAHLWWRDADTTTWEDWLNEGFAEYCAITAVRSRLGDAVAQALLMAKRERTAGLPPIYGLARDDDKAQMVLYDKGCLALTGLEQRIGAGAMAELLRRAWQEQTRSTGELLCLLSRVAGKTASEWLADELRR